MTEDAFGYWVPAGTLPPVTKQCRDSIGRTSPYRNPEAALVKGNLARTLPPLAKRLKGRLLVNHCLPIALTIVLIVDYSFCHERMIEVEVRFVHKVVACEECAYAIRIVMFSVQLRSA